MGLSIVCNKYNFIINTNEKNRNFLKKIKIRKLLWNTRKMKFYYKKIYLLLILKKDFDEKLWFNVFILYLNLIM